MRIAAIFAMCCLGLSAQMAISLKAGLLNFGEGQLETTAAGVGRPRVSAFRLRCGEELLTRRGRAELLLEPAIFLRMDDGSHIVMESDTLGEVVVRLASGSVIIDAVDVPKSTHTRLAMGGQVFEIRHVGIYRFNADSGRITVYDGKLDLDPAVHMAIKKGHAWDAHTGQPSEFDEKQVDRFQRWSARRAVAVAQSNLVSARSSFGYGWRRATRSWQFSLRTNLSAARAKVSVPQPGF